MVGEEDEAAACKSRIGGPGKLLFALLLLLFLPLFLLGPSDDDKKWNCTPWMQIGIRPIRSIRPLVCEYPGNTTKNMII